MRRILLLLICAWCFCSDANAAPEYDAWVALYTRTNFAAGLGDQEASPIRLIITAVEGEEKPAVRFFDQTQKFITELRVDGSVSHLVHTGRGTKGTRGGEPVSNENLQRLDLLLSKLPEDGSRLPPAGRRVVVQHVGEDNRSIVRVYDRGNAPETVWEIARLTRCGIRVWVPEFSPAQDLKADSHINEGFLGLSPDGYLLFAGKHGPLQVWDPTAHEFLGEYRFRNMLLEGIVFSPDGSKAAIAGDYKCVLVNPRTWEVIQKLPVPAQEERSQSLFAPRFTPDGQHLLVESTEPGLRIFDATNGQRVQHLPDIPADTAQFIPSSDNTLALVRSKSGTVSLRNVKKRHTVAALDQNTFISQAVFSPDGSLVAVATAQKIANPGYYDAPRIRIWETEKGRLLHELRPFGRSPDEKVEGLIWSPDGQYVLAVTKAHSFFTSRGVSVFNAKSGRHRGEFTGGASSVIGLALLPGGNLVTGSTDGTIRFWDFSGALEQIRKFEGSFESP